MSTPVIAAGAGALGFYLWLRQWQQCGYAGVRELPFADTHVRTEAPPSTWSETIYLFKEAIRYMYQETFGRWHAIDLFFGLAYLSRRTTEDYPAADIAAAGQPLTSAGMSAAAAQQLLLQLEHVRRYMLYCQGLRHHKPEQQLKHWKDMLQVGDKDIVCRNPTAGLLKPAYVIVQDRSMKQIILCVRGTHSRPDMFTSLTGAVKPHHALTPGGVVLGYSHLGMLAAARWLLSRTKDTLITALRQNPGYQLKIVGHSMGGGTAAMLTMMLRDKVPQLASATAFAIACPACMTLQLAASCAPFVTTLVHGTDVVPTFSAGAIDALRQEVTQSSWFAEFQSDVRQRLATNFNSSLRGLRQGAVGTAVWTQQKIVRTAAAPFSSCYSRAPRSCYSRGRQKGAATARSAGEEGSSPADAAAVAPVPSLRQNPLSSLTARFAGSRAARPAAAVDVIDAHDYVVDSSGAQVAESEHFTLLKHSTAAPWWWVWGSTSTQHSSAAPGQSDGSGGDAMQPSRNMEAELVEQALEACLSAADSGQYSLAPSVTAQSTAATDKGQKHEGFGSMSSSSSRLFRSSRGPGAAVVAGSSSRELPGSFVFKAASRAVLGKRPTAPGKKDDDDVSNTAKSSVTGTASGGISAAAVPGSRGASLPVSTTAGEAPCTTDPAAVTASSAGKPVPDSLRRRGWPWGSVLGSSVIGAGWVTDPLQQSSTSDVAGRSVVRYVGEAVGSTGRLVLQGTGQLLKSSVVFQACTVPAVQHPAAAAAGGVEGGQQQELPACTASVQQDSNHSSKMTAGVFTTAPGSSTDLMRMDRDDGHFATAMAGAIDSSGLQRGCSGASEEDLDGNSESDPDLIEEQQEDGQGALNQPAMRASASALMAAASSTGDRGELIARAHREEADAAEQLLSEAGAGASHPNLVRMAEELAELGDEHDAWAATDSSGPVPAAACATNHEQHDQHSEGGVDKVAERMARRLMFPAGRILHLMPATVVASVRGKDCDHLSSGSGKDLNGNSVDKDGISSSGGWCASQQLRPLTAVAGTAGLGDNYVLLELPTAEVYGRMRLCPSMVKDHFIPSYLKAIDNVIGQLMLLDSSA